MQARFCSDNIAIFDSFLITVKVVLEQNCFLFKKAIFVKPCHLFLIAFSLAIDATDHTQINIK